MLLRRTAHQAPVEVAHSDLLAAAASGLAQLALVSADVRGLDRSAVEQMRAGGASVVGVFAPGDESSERHLRQLGVDDVLVADPTVRRYETSFIKREIKFEPFIKLNPA